VFEAFAEEEEVGAAETVVLIAAKGGGGVDIGASERLLEIERNEAGG